MEIETNVGRTDQIVRITGGTVLIGLGLNAIMDTCVPEIYAPVFAAIGGVLLGTGVIRKCPFNHLAGIDTNEESENAEREE